MRAPQVFALALLVLPGVAFAQEPLDFPEETLACLETELQEAGFTTTEIDDLLEGRVENPEATVKSRIGDEGILEIGRTCFPEGFETSPPDAEPTGEPPTLTPEQRACVTQYLDQDLLDRILRGEVRPEDVLSPENMQKIGQACFADAAPTERVPVPPTLNLPEGVAACLKNAVGEQAFNEISSGQRPPTPEEMALGQPCFPSGPQQGPGGAPGGIQDLPPDVEQCVLGIIGREKFDQAKTSDQPETVLTPDEMRRVGETCFGGAPPGGHQGGPPSDVIACVEGALGKARAEELLRGVPPTPEEMERARGCFPQHAAIIEVSSPVEACVKQALGTERYAALQHGGAQFSPEDNQKVQGCFPTSGPVSGGAGKPPPTYNVEECVASCKAQTGDTGDTCERACRDESVTFPAPSPLPIPEPQPQTAPPPTYDSSQCIAACTGSPTKDGTTYSAEECQQLCAGGQQGTTPWRSSVAGAETERAAPWWLTFLLGVIGL